MSFIVLLLSQGLQGPEVSEVLTVVDLGKLMWLHDGEEQGYIPDTLTEYNPIVNFPLQCPGMSLHKEKEPTQIPETANIAIDFELILD